MAFILIALYLLVSTCAPVACFISPRALRIKTIAMRASTMESTNALPLPAFSPDFLANNDLFESIWESEEDIQRILQSLELVHVPAGSAIIKEGQDGDRAMYFLETGELSCTIQNVGTVATYKNQGDYFGELSMIFDQPRAASITAITDTLLWKLNSGIFLDSVDVSDAGKKLLNKKYQRKGAADLSVLSQVSARDAYDLAVALSRPKRERASFHSNLSRTAAFSSFMVLLTLWSFGDIDAFGQPMIFKTESLPASLLQAQFTATLFCLASILGMLRVPKYSPPARAISFSYLSWLTTSAWTLGLSNLTGLESNLFPLDAWSSSKWIILFPFLVSVIKTLEKLNDAIVGTMRGKQTVTFETPRIAGVAKATSFYVLTLLLGSLLVPMLGTYEDFVDNTAPLLHYHDDEFLGAFYNLCWMQNILTAAAAFSHTLTFERKVKLPAASVGSAVFLLIALWDVFRFATAPSLALIGDPDRLEAVSTGCPYLLPGYEYYIHIIAQNHLAEFFVGLYGFTLLCSLLQVEQGKNETNSSNADAAALSKTDFSGQIMIDIALMLAVVVGVFLISLE